MAKTRLITVTLTLPDGTRKYYRAKTKEEAEAKRDKDKTLLGVGIDIKDESTFQQAAELWFYLFKEDRLSNKSKETVKNTLKTHIYPVLGSKKVKEIRPADIYLLMKSISGKSKSLQSKVIQYTRAVFALAVDNGLIPKTPVPSFLKAGGTKTEEVESLTDEQCVTLLDAVHETRAFLFVELLLYTGLRRGEALGLMWQDIDFEKAELHVCRSIVYTDNKPAGEINNNLKTANARRVIPIVPWLLEDLRTEKLKSSALYVFSMQDGRYLSKASLRRLWDLVERRVDFKVHPHQLRHTCITRWVENGLDLKEAQYLAGHSNPQITMGIYAHYRKGQLWTETASKIAAIR